MIRMNQYIVFQYFIVREEAESLAICPSVDKLVLLTGRRTQRTSSFKKWFAPYFLQQLRKFNLPNPTKLRQYVQSAAIPPHHI